jgi:hypothetical protein
MPNGNGRHIVPHLALEHRSKLAIGCRASPALCQRSWIASLVSAWSTRLWLPTRRPQRQLRVKSASLVKAMHEKSKTGQSTPSKTTSRKERTCVAVKVAKLLTYYSDPISRAAHTNLRRPQRRTRSREALLQRLNRTYWPPRGFVRFPLLGQY